jgi:primosomal protein N'
MYVVSVMPFLRGSQVETLTYYMSESCEEGAIVSIPVRNRDARGLVVSVEPVSAAKAAIRAATFSLRKLAPQTGGNPIPAPLRETAVRLTTVVPTTVGAALFALLPPEIRDGTAEYQGDNRTPTTERAGIVSQPSILTAETSERYRVYRSRIREAFAHRGSVLFLVPTSADVEYAYEELARGIEDRLVVFSPRFGAKKMARAYEALADMRHAKLVIATPRHAFLERHDFTTIIVEQSRSPYYKSAIRPYLDTREVMKILATVANRELMLGDLLPATEDEWRRREEVYQTADEHPKRYTFESAFKIIKQNEKPTGEEPFRLFSTQLSRAIERLNNERGHMLLLAARRGLAPVVACNDCGYIFRCPDSHTPYSLIQTEKNGVTQRWFVSPTSGRRVRAADTCARCGSWRLAERGIGIQQIEAELQAKFPHVPVSLFDHTTATTYRKAVALISDFYDAKSAVLLATPMVLPYLTKPITASAVVSLDATRAMPTWRADEELVALLLTLRERTTGVVYVQTRTDTDPLLDAVTRGLTDQFYTDELELRGALGYPPVAVFVHCAYGGTAEVIAELETAITEAAAPYKPQYYTPTSTRLASVSRNALIRVPHERWPDPALMDRLRTLPPSVRIEIDPQRIV